MRLGISACLLGEACRYDGASKPSAAVRSLARAVRAVGGSVVPVCPEVAGGLPTPRLPAELRGGRVVRRDGVDVTEAFRSGALASWESLQAADVPPLAVLKAKSPSCGVNLVHDGSFSGRLVRGSGVFAQLLSERGVMVATEDEVFACKPSVEHPVALVLGTGLGHLSGLVKPVRRIDYRDIDDFPASARPVVGHSFEATIGTIDGVPVVVYPGRVHLYQGYSALEVTALVRHAHRLGCRVVVFACATGAIGGKAETGLGIISDHINFTGTNPLIGWHGGLGRFVPTTEERPADVGFADMTDVYTPYLRGIARGVAADLGLAVSEGTLAGVLGPSFETPAEVAALGAMGASYVGMSTVCEAIMAHALGMKVLGLTLAANYAGAAGVSHQSVLVSARAHAEEFEQLVRGVLALL